MPRRPLLPGLHSRTGWYALAAFIALIALVAGGVLLYQSLTKEQGRIDRGARRSRTTSTSRSSDVTGALDALGPPVRGDRRGERRSYTEDFVAQTDPVAGTIVPEGRVIKLYYNPTKELVEVPNVDGRTLDDATAILGTERVPDSARNASRATSPRGS